MVAAFVSGGGELAMRLSQIFLFRFPLLQALVLSAIPLAALTFARDMLGNLFVLGPWGFFWVTLLGIWCGWAIMVVVTLIFRYGAARFRTPALTLAPWGQWVRRNRQWAFGLLGGGAHVLAGLWATWQGVPAPPWPRIGLAIVLGILVALFLSYCTQLLRQLLVSPDAEHDNLLFPHDNQMQRRLHELDTGIGVRLQPWRSRLARWFGPGFYNAERDDFESGHLMALAVNAVVLTVYVVVGVVTRPGQAMLAGFPALGYLLLMIWIFTLVLGGAGFIFDRWRVPTLLTLLSISFFGYLLMASDYRFETRALAGAGTLPTAAQAIAAWQADFEGAPPRLIVVAASGGGITAASWATHVLGGIEGGLDDDLARRFTRSLGAISAVSGGSVGTLFYLSGFERGVTRDAQQLAAIRDGAAVRSVRSVAWGMAYPDMWRFLFAPLAWLWPGYDRAWALEMSWRRELEEIEGRGDAGQRVVPSCRERLASAPAMSVETLHCFGQRLREGQVPVPLFNTTEVETGDAMVFAPIDLPNQAGRPFVGFDSFGRRWPRHDVELLTATRLSATFPWVTPVARGPALADGSFLHLADGGYFDNAGMATLVEWLELVLGTTSAIKDVLVIRIDAAEDDQTGQTKGLQAYGRRLLDGGWAAETIGPVRTLMQVRGATQGARNLRALDLQRHRWQLAMPARRISVACFLRNDRGLPLSWRLTESQRQKIANDWENGSRGRRSEAFDLVERFLRGEVEEGGEVGCDR